MYTCTSSNCTWTGKGRDASSFLLVLHLFEVCGCLHKYPAFTESRTASGTSLATAMDGMQWHSGNLVSCPGQGAWRGVEVPVITYNFFFFWKIWNKLFWGRQFASEVVVLLLMCCKRAGAFNAELSPTHTGTITHTSMHKTAAPGRLYLNWQWIKTYA